MRNILSFSIGIIIFFLAIYQCAGQQAPPDLQKINAGKPYRIWLFSKTDRLRQVGGGEIYRLSDDSVTLVRPGRTLMKVNSYAVKDIDQIWLRQKSNLKKGVLIGATAGLLTGVIIGLVAGDDPECSGQCWFDNRLTAGDKALIGGILLTPIGGVLGLAAGSAKIKIPIDRKQDKYQRVKGKLDTIRYVPQR